MNRFEQGYVLALLALAGAALAPPASALVIGGTSLDPLVDLTDADVGRSFVLDWHVSAGAQLTTSLSATSTVKVDSFSSDQLILDFTIRNQTDAAFLSSISSLGLAVSPDVSASVVQAPTDFPLYQQLGTDSGGRKTSLGGLQGTDVCVYTAHGCRGDVVKSGLLSGNSDTFQLKLTSNTTGGFAGKGDAPKATLGAFGLKWQTAQGSFQTGGTPLVPMPAPGTLGLMGGGLAALGLSRRLAGRPLRGGTRGSPAP